MNLHSYLHPEGSDEESVNLSKEELEYLQNHASSSTETLREIRRLSDKIDRNQRELEESAKRQQKVDRRRFWAALVGSLVGSIAAVGGLIATIVLS